jgi:tRNA(fMet)-specific endonuclease VapC
MFLLDTDHLTLLERGGGGSLALQMRLDVIPAAEIATTVINYEEQMRGWLSRVAQAGGTANMLRAYAQLYTHIEMSRGVRLLPFNASASSQFDSLRRTRIRVGTTDLKIAAICLAHGATLLTRNLVDFGKVPGLKVEDRSI